MRRSSGSTRTPPVEAELIPVTTPSTCAPVPLSVCCWLAYHAYRHPSPASPPAGQPVGITGQPATPTTDIPCITVTDTCGFNSSIDVCARVACEDPAPVDIVFAIDSSGSISSEDFERVVQLVSEVVQSLTIRTEQTPNGFQVALVSFADDADVRFNLTAYNDKELMLAAVNARYTHGRTNVSEALR